MSRGGSFGPFDVVHRHFSGWRKLHAYVLFKMDQKPAALENPHTSVQRLGIDPGLHKGVGPGGVGKALSEKASSIVLR